MKRLLTVLAVGVASLVYADSAKAQFVNINYNRPVGNNGFLSIGYSNLPAVGGVYNPYGFARPSYVAPIYNPGFVSPFGYRYVQPVYTPAFYPTPYYGGFYRGGVWIR